jgi:XXXCH domain-containing protein
VEAIVSNKHSQSRSMENAAAAGYLRQLADGLDRGEVALDSGLRVPLHGAIKIKESLKPEDGKLRISFKVSLAPHVLPDALGVVGHHRPARSYKRLKKRMKRDFKLLQSAARQGSIPVELVRRFHADCRSMSAFTDKGEEYYPQFDRAADALLSTAEAGDIPGMRRVLDELVALRDEAHRQYK